MKMRYGAAKSSPEASPLVCLSHTNRLSKGGWVSEQKDRRDGLGSIMIHHLGLGKLPPQTKWDLLARGRSKELDTGQQ